MECWFHRGGQTPCITFCGIHLDLPDGYGVRITRNRGPYWFFRGPLSLLTHRRIDQLGEWLVSSPFWEPPATREAWERMRELWRPYLDWCMSCDLRPDIFVSRDTIHVDWVALPRRYCGGFRWESIPPFQELEERTSGLVRELTQVREFECGFENF
ncbi:MAG TPA: hypothetical protein VHC22_00745 [Pirellulales bacterium]|nr:hypothetical protein [Pirellulales bacterium]